MDTRYIITLISLLLCTCLSSCHRGISTSASPPAEELSQFSDEFDMPAYLFNKPMIAVFQTRFTSYRDDLFQPEITFAVWDNGTFLLKENRNYVTGALSVQSLSDVNNIMNDKRYCSCLTKWLPQYHHSNLYYSILSTENKDYSAKSSLRLTGADDLDDMSDIQISDKSSIAYVRKTNDTIKEHLKKSTTSGTFSLSEENVMQIVSKWGYGPPYLTNEEIKEIIQGGDGPPLITNENSSKTD
ncbi:hypothetical protein Enr10x_23100 [Gimesia panareensis]|uniref:Uncharacterized protein n=1 Tax=Gimesia panareensis TaxID=2527978 RepID=A0A517Q5S4_9PLAN|nr:hypothetical protein [Gimesia panareensis]QDT26997.1 hypothetical protein Enr10x_23100 [Gimesia panareensis]